MVLKLWLLPSYNIGNVKKIILCEVWRNNGRIELDELWSRLQLNISDRKVFDENLDDLLCNGVSVRGFIGLAFRLLFKAERCYPLRKEEVDGKVFIYQSDKLLERDYKNILLFTAFLAVFNILSLTLKSTPLIYATSIAVIVVLAVVFTLSRLLQISIVEVLGFNRVLQLSVLRLRHLGRGFQVVRQGRCEQHSMFKVGTTIREVIERCLGEDSVGNYEVLYADTKPPYIKHLRMASYLFEENLPEESTLIAIPLDERKILEDFTSKLKEILTPPRTESDNSRSKRSKSRTRVLKISIPEFCKEYPMPIEIGLPLCLKTAREEGWTIEKMTIRRRLT
ncbi:MAG: hypothetical protein ABDH32_05480 [Candidatus Caldarchaeales archaeon]